MNEILSERVNLFEPYDCIGFILKLSGMVSIQAITDAVQKAYEANESTMSQIEILEDSRAVYTKREKSGCCISIENGDPMETYRQNIRKPFALKDGEMVRTFIFPEDKGTQVLILSHHLAGDGLAVTEFIHEILEALDGKELEYRPLQLMTHEWMNERGKLPQWIFKYAHKQNSDWAKVNKVFTWEDYQKIYDTYWETREPSVKLCTYDEKEFQAIHEQCKKWNVTVNSYITAKLQQEHKDAVMIGMPVSVREGCKSMNNMTAGIKFRQKYRGNWSLERSAREIGKNVQKHLKKRMNLYLSLTFIAELTGSLMDGALMQYYHLYDSKQTRTAAKIIYDIKDQTELGVTNLGNLEMKTDYDSFQLKELIFMPPKVSYAKRTIGVVTLNGRMNVATMEIDTK